MELATWLTRSRAEILADAHARLARATPPSQREGANERLTELFDAMVACVRDRQVSRMTKAVDRLAARRFGTGSLVPEVQTAVNTLEEATWSRLVVAARHDGDLGKDLTVVSTVLGVAKDRLAQAYVLLTAHAETRTFGAGALAQA